MKVENDLFADFGLSDIKKKEDTEDKPQQRLRCHTEKAKLKFDKRRFTSEQNMLEAIDWHFRNGYNYHIMSHGDVDSQSFLI